MHLLPWLPDGTDDVRLAARAQAVSLVVRPITRCMPAVMGAPA
jgi:hypothetical protein